MSLDLLLRYLIIAIAAHLACAWMHTFQSPWPLVDAFELADCAEEQLFRSLGVSLSNFKASLKPLLHFALAVRCRVALLRRGFSATSGRSSGWLARDDDMEISLTFPELNLNSL